MTLSHDVYAAIQKHRVPVDVRHLAKLARSPRRMELYTWLSYRTPQIRRGTRVPISLSALHTIFGADFARLRDFKRRLKSDLVAIHAVYREFQVELDGEVMWLEHSPPPIPYERNRARRRDEQRERQRARGREREATRNRNTSRRPTPTRSAERRVGSAFAAAARPVRTPAAERACACSASRSQPARASSPCSATRPASRPVRAPGGGESIVIETPRVPGGARTLHAPRSRRPGALSVPSAAR